MIGLWMPPQTTKGVGEVGPTGTMSMIHDVLARAPHPLSLAELTEQMLGDGWDTQSERQSNTMRSALMRCR